MENGSDEDIDDFRNKHQKNEYEFAMAKLGYEEFKSRMISFIYQTDRDYNRVETTKRQFE